MNHVYRTINRYHHCFESYRGVITLKSFWVWLSLFGFLAFLYSFYWYLDDSIWPYYKLSKINKLLITMGFEVVILVCWFRLQVLRGRAVVERCQKILGTDEKDIIKLKEIWFETFLSTQNISYLEVAKDIDEMVSLRNKYKSRLVIDKKQVFDLVFSSESKGRVLAMFMGVSAGVVALSIAGGANIDTVLSFYANEEFSELLLLVFTLSVFGIVSFMASRYFLLIVLLPIELIFDKADGINSSSPRRVAAFVNQLIALHSLDKGRVTASKFNKESKKDELKRASS